MFRPNNAGAIMASDESLVGIPDVAAYFQLSGYAGYRCVGTQGVPAQRVGHLFRFRFLQVNECAQNHIGGASTKASCSPNTLHRDRGHGAANG